MSVSRNSRFFMVKESHSVMSASYQIVDSLWLCLCPSFRTLAPSSARFSRARYLQYPQFQPPRQSRSLASLTEKRRPEHNQKQWRQRQQSKKDVRKSSRDDYFNQQRQLFREKHRHDSAEKLQKTLQEAAARGDRQWAWDLMEMLIKGKGVKPEAKHYAMLVEANCSIHDGSLDEVQRLLEEMQELGIKPTQDVFDALLKVLAIHPSYTLRSAVLDEMKRLGMNLNAEGWAHIVSGLLRERQIELALDELAKMHGRGFQPPRWLLDSIIHVLADIGEFDALFPLLVNRSEDTRDPPSQILYSSVLVKAAKELHHPTVSFIWTNEVVEERLNPSSGVCAHVLDTAARAGDPVLATDVFRVLGDRSSPLTAFQYEALIESHLSSESPDIQKVFNIISIMSQSKRLPVTDQTTRSVFKYLESEPDRIEEAFETLKDLKGKGVSCPVEVANAIIEAAVVHGMIEWAMDAYKQLDVISESKLNNGATVFTFNILLRGCYKARRKSLAMFVAAEMVALKVSPDPMTYDRLILACIHGNGGAPEEEATTSSGKTPVKSPLKEQEEQDQKDLDDAFRYLGEMQSRDWWPRKGTLNLLGLKAIECNDSRVQDLIRWMESIGTDADIIKAKLPSR